MVHMLWVCSTYSTCVGIVLEESLKLLCDNRMAFDRAYIVSRTVVKSCELNSWHDCMYSSCGSI